MQPGGDVVVRSTCGHIGEKMTTGKPEQLELDLSSASVTKGPCAEVSREVVRFSRGKVIAFPVVQTRTCFTGDFEKARDTALLEKIVARVRLF